MWIVLVTGCGRIGFDALGGPNPDALANTCPSNALLCDDFESGDIGRWTAMNVAGAGSLAVDAVHVRSGAYGLHAVVDPAPLSGNAAYVMFDMGTQTTGTVSVREWVLVDQPLTNFDIAILLRTPSLDRYGSAAVSAAGMWVSSDF